MNYTLTFRPLKFVTAATFDLVMMINLKLATFFDFQKLINFLTKIKKNWICRDNFGPLDTELRINQKF